MISKRQGARRIGGQGVAAVCLALLMMLPWGTIYAHGEIAQMAGIRMQSVHWFDTEIYPRNVAVNETVTVKGKFVVSNHWPSWLPSVEGWAFLNIGVPGPTFIREDVVINGMHQIRSTAFKFGEYYEYEVTLKARVPGRWHVHPLINVWEAGPIVGPAHWVEVTGSKGDFVHEATLLTGEVIDVENYGLDTQWTLHIFWMVVGVLWLWYWFRKPPVLMRRYVTLEEKGEDEGESKLITLTDVAVSIFAVLFVLGAALGWTIYANSKYPVTIPLQTGKIEAPVLPPPPEALAVKASVQRAEFNLPRRSLALKLEVTNGADRPIRVGEFLAGGARFVNPDVLKVERVDFYDSVAPDGVISNDPPLQPGETRVMTIVVEDALWEELRLSAIVYEADLQFAGMLFFYDDLGNRYFTEVGGTLIPQFLPSRGEGGRADLEAQDSETVS
ncbi:MAG: bacterial ammonia monooxygenase, subunit AmoB [Pseudomonadota bacterium]|nr:bacterial ammonia monooxygenase, subunit AmoB [Pseudomonadota bacterium]